MANEIGHAFIALVPSFSGTSAAIKRQLTTAGVGTAIERELTGTATRAGTHAGGLFSRAFNTHARNAIHAPIQAQTLRNLSIYSRFIGIAAGATVGFGLKTASALEQAKVAFTTMLGSAKRATTTVAQLAAFARKTPFQFTDVVHATQQLLAFGFTAKQVKPTLTAIGDAAAGLGLGADGIERITVALGQISAKGRVQSQELLQLNEAGVPALKILANQFGLTTSALTQYVEKGLIPADKAIPALLSGIEHGTNGVAGATTRFGGLMRKQSHTLGGVFSNLKDTVSLGLAKAVRPLAVVLERELPRATKPLRGAFRSAARDMAEFLHGLGVARDRSKGVSTGFEQFGSVLRGTFHAVRSTFGFISRNAKIFKPLAAAILGAVVALKAFRLVMVGVNLVMDANPISLVVIAIGALVAGFIYAYKKSDTFRRIVVGVFHAVERAAGFMVRIVVGGLKLIVDGFLGFAGTMLHAAASAFGWVPKLGGKLKGAARSFDAFKSHVDGTFEDIARTASGWGLQTGQNWTQGFFSGVSGVPGEHGAIANALGQNKRKRQKQGQTAGGQIGQGITSGLTNGLDTGSAKVSKSMSGLVDKILSPLKSLLAKAKQLAQSVTQSILGETGFGALLNQTDAFGQTSFGTSVKSIIAGFVNQQRQVRRFRKELRLLDRKGLSAGAIEEIANLGVNQGGSLAETLLGGSRKQLRRISNLFGGTRSSARGIGNDVAGNRFGAQISHELVRTRNAIEKASKNTELGDKTIRKLRGGFAKQEKAAKVYLNTGQLDRHEGHVVASLT